MKQSIKFPIILIIFFSCSNPNSSENTINSPNKDSTFNVNSDEKINSNKEEISEIATPNDSATSDIDIQDDCVLEAKKKTLLMIKKNPEFASYIWDRKSNSAIIPISTTDTLIAQYIGCNHVGFNILSISKDMTEFQNINYWIEQGVKIAEKTFEQKEFQDFNRLIKGKKYEVIENEDRIYIIIKHSDYDSMSLSVDRNESNTQLRIGYYSAL